MKKLSLIVALIASTAPIIAMEEAELRQRNRKTLPDDNKTVTKIDPQTRYYLHCCATCVGCCCGILQTTLIFNALDRQCQNNHK